MRKLALCGYMGISAALKHGNANERAGLLLRLGKSCLRVYLAVLVVMFVSQRCMMYPKPTAAALPPSARGKLIAIDGPMRRRVHAFHIPARGGLPTVVIFHGNAEQLADQVPLAEELADQGLGAYAVEYPGYGPSSDSSTNEDDVYADAEAALQYLESKLGVERRNTVLLGRSLGTGVTIEMVTRGYGARVILLSPYTSMIELAAKNAPFLPTRWLVLDRYDSLAKAPRVAQPALVIHGANDEVVPSEMAVALAERLRRSKVQLVPFAGHNDLLQVGGPALWGSIVSYAKGTESDGFR